MQILIVTCCLIALASAALVPTRQQRDISELAPAACNYLRPETKLDVPVSEAEIHTEVLTFAPTPTPASTLKRSPAAITKSGYEYRTVRHLKLRTQRVQRDVSHLDTRYLPPTPEQQYLPPALTGAPAPEEPDTEVVNAAPIARLANDYVPPVEDALSTAIPDVLAETEVPPAQVFEAESPGETANGDDQAPQDTAVLSADGYHYKQPYEVPELYEASTAIEYLPPSDKDNISLESPEKGALGSSNCFQ